VDEESRGATWRGRLRHLTPARLLAWAGDGHDERRAERRRAELGRQGWLVSWLREPDGGWRARLSGPHTVRTIERTARTRRGAIERAWRAGVGMLAFRATHRPGSPCRDAVDLSRAEPE
jgi:hypothetical protein